MSKPLITYLQDHLAGAQFALALLDDLTQQQVDLPSAELAALLLPEIDEDRTVLEDVVGKLDASTSTLKEATAWFTQKASRAKLNISQHFGIFEAVELLSLGVLGKRALWRALHELQGRDGLTFDLDLDELIRRAEQQHARLETLRLALSRRALSEQK